MVGSYSFLHVKILQFIRRSKTCASFGPMNFFLFFFFLHIINAITCVRLSLKHTNRPPNIKYHMNMWNSPADREAWFLQCKQTTLLNFIDGVQKHIRDKIVTISVLLRRPGGGVLENFNSLNLNCKITKSMPRTTLPRTKFLDPLMVVNCPFWNQIFVKNVFENKVN